MRSDGITRPQGEFLYKKYSPEQFRTALTRGTLEMDEALNTLQSELRELTDFERQAFSKAYGICTGDGRQWWVNSYKMATIVVDRTFALAEIYNEVIEQKHSAAVAKVPVPA